MVVGESRTTRLLLSMLDENSKMEIENYVNDIVNRDFMVINSESEVNSIFDKSISDFVSSLSEEEKMILRSYTGYNFRNINAILRDNWSYENNGLLTEEKKIYFKQLAYEISNIISKFQMPNIDLVSFRGTTLDSFSSYGVKTLSDLEYLKGKFLYEAGFTSTSVLKSESYFNRTLEDGRFYNVGIRYLIPSDSEDIVLLSSNDLSYSIGQNELLLDTASLSKVIDVSVDEKNNTAILTVVFIPKKVYDLYYKKGKNGSKNI